MDIPAHETGACRSGNVTLRYRKFGAPGRTPVLIVHGLSYFSYDWIGVGDALADGREVVAQDMRGFGDSDWSPDADYSLDTFADDIGELCDHFGWANVVLVGHSMGGRNVTYFASRRPDRVAALVLVDYSPVNAPEGSERVTRTVAGVPNTFTSVDEAIRYFGKDASDDRIRARMEAYLRPVEGGFAIKRDTVFRDRFRKVLETGERPKLPVDMWDELAAVAAPILVLRGRRSDMFAQATASRVKSCNPRLGLVELDTGHDVAGEDPGGLVREITNFLHREDR
ncbi:MAG: alpha/beta hydrolase [Alphaproteobacteria bacterium]|nr:alpha/beta hydrolase [Alphaproteobacteria bacterium]